MNAGQNAMTWAEYFARGDGEAEQMSCGKCGQFSGASRWSETEIFGELPAGEFQCPKCGSAYRKERVEGDRYQFVGNSYVYVGPVRLVPIATRL